MYIHYFPENTLRNSLLHCEIKSQKEIEDCDGIL